MSSLVSREIPIAVSMWRTFRPVRRE
jgi:hypothetical protein